MCVCVCVCIYKLSTLDEIHPFDFFLSLYIWYEFWAKVYLKKKKRSIYSNTCSSFWKDYILLLLNCVGTFVENHLTIYV